MKLNANSCGDCGHFNRDGAPNNKTSFCRRFPPIASPILVPVQHKVTREQIAQVQNHTCWPLVEETAVCGEWKSRILLS